MKSRRAQNGIHSLLNTTGCILQSKTDIKDEILSFYKQLLGTSADQVTIINPQVMKEGGLLNRERQMSLTLMDIDDSKAPGCDGLNALSFKRTCS